MIQRFDSWLWRWDMDFSSCVLEERNDRKRKSGVVIYLKRNLTECVLGKTLTFSEWQTSPKSGNQRKSVFCAFRWKIPHLLMACSRPISNKNCFKTNSKLKMTYKNRLQWQETSFGSQDMTTALAKTALDVCVALCTQLHLLSFRLLREQLHPPWKTAKVT